MKSKPTILTISYHNEKIANLAYDQLYKTAPDTDVYLLDNNYPLLKNKNCVIDICEKYGFKYFNTGHNLGLHDGYNYLMNQCDADVVILYDGDSYPITDNWHIPLTKLHEDPWVVWSSLHNQHSYREMDERGFTPVELFGYNCRIPSGAVINSISAFRRAWVDDVGGFTEPSKYYGGLEVAMWARKSSEYKWVFLDDYTEVSIPNIWDVQDRIYTEYKVAHALQGDPRSFEEYVSQRSS